MIHQTPSTVVPNHLQPTNPQNRPQANGKVVLLEASSSPLAWPFVSRGKLGDVKTAQQWQLDAGDVGKVVGGVVSYSGIEPNTFRAAGGWGRVMRGSRRLCICPVACS
jgi:hypothetical protein